MKLSITPSKVNGSLTVPPSKSHTLRALLFAMLAKGTSKITGFLHSPDAFNMIEAAKLFGAEVAVEGENATITGVGTPPPPPRDVINAGNSGIILRFLGGIASLLPQYTVITGDHSIRTNRPVKPLLDAIQGLGGFAVSTKGDQKAPIIIKGPLHSGTTTLDGSDSQPVSAMLIACSLAQGPFELHVTNPGETPWIDFTIHWMEKRGLQCIHENYRKYQIPGGGSISPFEYHVPGDFSSAAFPIAAALITKSTLTIRNLDMNDIQGDKKLLEGLRSIGATYTVDMEKQEITVQPSTLYGGTLDINEYIDSITILAVIGCYCTEPLTITNAAIARAKESDRIHAIATELKKMGAMVEEKPDGLTIFPSELTGATVTSYNDHRMVLSLACAALGASGETHIENTACIAKTYPSFVEDMKAIGAKIKVTE